MDSVGRMSCSPGWSLHRVSLASPAVSLHLCLLLHWWHIRSWCYLSGSASLFWRGNHLGATSNICATFPEVNATSGRGRPASAPCPARSNSPLAVSYGAAPWLKCIRGVWWRCLPSENKTSLPCILLASTERHVFCPMRCCGDPVLHLRWGFSIGPFFVLRVREFPPLPILYLLDGQEIQSCLEPESQVSPDRSCGLPPSTPLHLGEASRLLRSCRIAFRWKILIGFQPLLPPLFWWDQRCVWFYLAGLHLERCGKMFLGVLVDCTPRSSSEPDERCPDQPQRRDDGACGRVRSTSGRGGLAGSIQWHGRGGSWQVLRAVDVSLCYRGVPSASLAMVRLSSMELGRFPLARILQRTMRSDTRYPVPPTRVFHLVHPRVPSVTNVCASEYLVRSSSWCPSRWERFSICFRFCTTRQGDPLGELSLMPHGKSGWPPHPGLFYWWWGWTRTDIKLWASGRFFGQAQQRETDRSGGPISVLGPTEGRIVVWWPPRTGWQRDGRLPLLEPMVEGCPLCASHRWVLALAPGGSSLVGARSGGRGRISLLRRWSPLRYLDELHRRGQGGGRPEAMCRLSNGHCFFH